MEFVSRSSFQTFNPEFQFNGAEAALVFPCLHVPYWFCTVPVPAAWTQVIKPAEFWECSCHSTVGNSKDEEPFPSSLTSGRKSLSLQKEEAATAAIASPFSWGHCLAWKKQTSSWKLTCSTHRVCGVSVSVSLSWGWSLVFQTACLANCGAIPELPNVQLLF